MKNNMMTGLRKQAFFCLASFLQLFNLSHIIWIVSKEI